MENEIIVESWSPVSNIQAFVEKTDRNYYFYLWVNPNTSESEILSCWICNRIPAPADIKEAFKDEGEAPCMPEEFVDHDPEGIDLDDDSLSIRWFEEGDSAAVLSDEKIIAVIPCFSGYNGFYGYSAFAKGTGPFAWELKGAYSRFEKDIKASDSFWAFFDESDFWNKVQTSQLDALEKFFGKHEKYYAIDGNEFPPKALVQGRKDGVIYGITLGVSMIPMPKVEMYYHEDYKDYRRMELGFACSERHEPLAKNFYSTISSLAAYPWRNLTFFGHGHTVPFRNIKGMDYLLFLNSGMLSGIEAPVYDDFMDEKINLLWVKPITADEQKEIADNGIEEYLKGKDLSTLFILK
ncbi:MAG: suppressor of fused domain protein [Clostridiales bacterium]|nr:suppressor of fused domain protein [Clostridiales bacterium]